MIPSDLGGLDLWFDASNAASITSSGGLISSWADLSGHSRPFTQTTDANKPSTGVRTIGSLNALGFSGAQYMTTPSFVHGPPATLFFVLQNDHGSNNQTENYYTTVGTSDHVLRCSKNVSNKWRIRHGEFVDLDALEGGAPDTAQHLLCAVFTYATSYLYLDGALIASGNTGANPSYDLPRQLGMGALLISPWYGSFGEIIHYDSMLSTSNRDGIMLYLSDKWDIGVDLDGSVSVATSATGSLTVTSPLSPEPFRVQRALAGKVPVASTMRGLLLTGSDVPPPSEPDEVFQVRREMSGHVNVAAGVSADLTRVSDPGPRDVDWKLGRPFIGWQAKKPMIFSSSSQSHVSV